MVKSVKFLIIAAISLSLFAAEQPEQPQITRYEDADIIKYSKGGSAVVFNKDTKTYSMAAGEYIGAEKMERREKEILQQEYTSAKEIFELYRNQYLTQKKSC